MTGPISSALFDQARLAAEDRDKAVKHVVESVRRFKSFLPRFSLAAQPGLADAERLSRQARLVKLGYDEANREYCRLRATAVQIALREFSIKTQVTAL